MRYSTPETLRIVCASIGIDRTALQELFGINSRTAQRWIATAPAPERIQDQIARWQAAFSAEIESALAEVDRSWSPGGDPVQLVRYPSVEMMPAADDGPDESVDAIWFHSPATYDVFVARLAATLSDQGVPFVVETALEPMPHVRFGAAA